MMEKRREESGPSWNMLLIGGLIMVTLLTDPPAHCLLEAIIHWLTR